jgi:hypothetical protein
MAPRLSRCGIQGPGVAEDSSRWMDSSSPFEKVSRLPDPRASTSLGRMLRAAATNLTSSSLAGSMVASQDQAVLALLSAGADVDGVQPTFNQPRTRAGCRRSVPNLEQEVIQ